MPDARISRTRYQELRDELAEMRRRLVALETREELAVQLAAQLAQACFALLQRQPTPPKRGSR